MILKKRLWLCCFIIIVLISTFSCKKEFVPEVTTITVSNITQTTATCGCIISNDGGADIIEKGVCWSSQIKMPTIFDNKSTDGKGSENFTSIITGLNSSTTYYVRAYATNSEGTGYSSSVLFLTQIGSGDTVCDIDGNLYHTVTIGTNTWMVENLKVTRYRNGDTIMHITENDQWFTLTGVYCNYDNIDDNSKIYGKLYNYFAVEDNRNIAPIGWHVPIDSDVGHIIYFLGGVSIAGGKIKEIGTTHWQSPNTDATNESGFTALPGGKRNIDGTFNAIYCTGYWWTNTKHIDMGFGVYMYFTGFDNSNLEIDYKSPYYGFSVRCIKD